MIPGLFGMFGNMLPEGTRNDIGNAFAQFRASTPQLDPMRNAFRDYFQQHPMQMPQGFQPPTGTPFQAQQPQAMPPMSQQAQPQMPPQSSIAQPQQQGAQMGMQGFRPQPFRGFGGFGSGGGADGRGGFGGGAKYTL